MQRAEVFKPYPIRHPRDLYAFMSDLRNESSEHIYEVLLDGKHRVSGVYLVGKGCINETPAYPFEIFKAAVASNSPAFALVHNHPSGVTDPSREDLNLVERVRNGAELLSLTFLDFIIIGADRYFSFSESGLIADVVVK